MERDEDRERENMFRHVVARPDSVLLELSETVVIR